MATITIYASSVSGASWTGPNNAAGSPSSGNSVPYATKAIGAGSFDTLTAAFDAVAIAGTITGVTAVVTPRSTVGGIDTAASFSASNLTFEQLSFVPITNFAERTNAANTPSAGEAASIRADLAAGTFTLDARFDTTAGATVDVKGFGIRLTYTPSNSIAIKDGDDSLLLTGTRR